MANPHKGEVALQHEGATYTLCFSTEAICALEDKVDLGVLEIFERLQSWQKDLRQARISFVRNVLWACLQPHHPGLSEKLACEIMDSCGGLIGTMNRIAESARRSFPDVPKENGSRPPKRARRTH